jgi:hypothetical protein
MSQSEKLYNQVMRRLREHEDRFSEEAPDPTGENDEPGVDGLKPAELAKALAAEPKFRDLHGFVTKYPEEAWMFGRAVRDRLAEDHEGISAAQKAAVLAALRKKLGG